MYISLLMFTAHKCGVAACSTSMALRVAGVWDPLLR